MQGPRGLLLLAPVGACSDGRLLVQQDTQAAVRPGREAVPPPSPCELRGLEAPDPGALERRGQRSGWKHPRAPRMALLFDDKRAAKRSCPSLGRLRVTVPPRGVESGEQDEGRGEEQEWEEGGGGGRKGGQPPRRNCAVVLCRILFRVATWGFAASGGGSDARYHLGANKEVFDAETFAIYQALRALDQRQESGHRYTVFADSTSAIDRVRSDALGPGQRFAVAAIEDYSRILARDNDVIIQWVPAHSGASGNEMADEYAKSAATGDAPVEEIPEGTVTRRPSPT